MGLGGKAKCKSMLRMRTPEGYLTNFDWHKTPEKYSDQINFLLIDFLLHIHKISENNLLTYESLQCKVEVIFIHFVRAFPNLKTMVILLDESKYTPLGKVPTQKKRGDALTMEERGSILEGGVLDNMGNDIIDSIDKTFVKHPSVTGKKSKTQFSVFFSKYVRTRALRDDLFRFIINCISKLKKTGKLPSELNIYVDGMSYSSNFASSSSYFHEDTFKKDDLHNKNSSFDSNSSTPTLKRRKSISVVGDINAHDHLDNSHLNVCKIEDKSVRWLTIKNGDAEIFGDHHTMLKRPNLGESDIKIPYYIRRLAESVNSILPLYKSTDGYTPESTTPLASVFISSWDTDIIPICFMELEHLNFIYPSIFNSLETNIDDGDQETYGGTPYAPALRVLLDTDPTDSAWNVLNYRKSLNMSDESDLLKGRGRTRKKMKGEYHVLQEITINENEDSYLTGIIDVYKMIHSIRICFSNIHPGVKNPIETICVLFMASGTDFVKSPSGIGFSILRDVFDAGGYMLLSHSIQILTINNENGQSINFDIRINEEKIVQFYNLCIRYSLGIGEIGKIKKELQSKKIALTKNIKKIEEVIKNLENNIDCSDIISFDGDSNEDINTFECEKYGSDINSAQKNIINKANKKLDREKKDRLYLDHFLWKSHYVTITELGAGMLNEQLSEIEAEDREFENELASYICSFTGMDKEEHFEWEGILSLMKKKRAIRILTKRKNMQKEFNKDSSNGVKIKNPDTGIDTFEKINIEDISDKRILDQCSASISDLSDISQIKSSVRRISWNIFYWKLSAYTCLRTTKYLNSMAKYTVGSKTKSLYGFSSILKVGETRKTIILTNNIAPQKNVLLKI